MSLKQKIQENTAIIYNILRSIEHEKHHTFPSGLIAHQDDKVLLLSDVLGLLDEATKELLNLAIHGLKEAQNGESSDCTSTFATIIEKLGIHVEYDEWHEPIIDAKQVKAVLEGAEQK